MTLDSHRGGVRCLTLRQRILSGSSHSSVPTLPSRDVISDASMPVRSGITSGQCFPTLNNSRLGCPGFSSDGDYFSGHPQMAWRECSLDVPASRRIWPREQRLMQSPRGKSIRIVGASSRVARAPHARRAADTAGSLPRERRGSACRLRRLCVLGDEGRPSLPAGGGPNRLAIICWRL
jgi:hypothetical protein